MIEPTKNVTPIAGRELDPHCEASAATVKHSDPSANSTLIHQPRRRGRHQTGSSALADLTATDVGRPLRWARERQRTSVPSGLRRTSLVTNGPGPSVETR